MRIQLDLSEEMVTRVRNLMTTAEIESYKELFNNTLTVFEWVVSQKQEGKFVAAVDPEKQMYRELVLPAIERAAAAVPLAVAAVATNNNHHPNHTSGTPAKAKTHSK